MLADLFTMRVLEVVDTHLFAMVTRMMDIFILTGAGVVLTTEISWLAI